MFNICYTDNYNILLIPVIKTDFDNSCRVRVVITANKILFQPVSITKVYNHLISSVVILVKLNNDYCQRLYIVQ